MLFGWTKRRLYDLFVECKKLLTARLVEKADFSRSCGASFLFNIKLFIATEVLGMVGAYVTTTHRGSTASMQAVSHLWH